MATTTPQFYPLSATPEQVKALRDTIGGMDLAAGMCFDQIRTLASLASRLLEAVDKEKQLNEISAALDMILSVSDITANDVNWMAESVGCNHKGA